jgi:hypothetical protein
MKSLYLVLGLIVSLAFSPNAALQAQTSPSAEAPIVAFVVKANDAFLQSDGKNEEVALHAGSRLSDGDRLRTGADGRVILLFIDDKSQLKLEPSTAILLHAKREGGVVHKDIELDMGDLWSRVTRGGGEFRVATSNSVSSVKGTAWWTRHTKDGQTKIITTEGIVELMAKQSGARIDVMMGNTGTSDGVVLDIHPTSENDESGLELGELKRIEIPVRDGEESRILVIEYYE